VAVAAVALAVLPISAQAAKPKPDLVVSRASVNPKEITTAGKAHFAARTKNTRKAEAVARASETALVLLHPPEFSHPILGTEVALYDVPRLRPGKSHSGGASGNVDFPLGAYKAKICADFKHKVRESNERNNCSDAVNVYVIAFEWSGTLQGTSPVDTGVNETWTSDDAHFVWDPNAPSLGPGRFTYVFRGSLHYAISGTDPDGCVYSGSDTATVDDAEDLLGGGLIVDYRNEEYFGDDDITPPDPPFAWHVQCPGDPEPQTVDGPYDFAAAFINVNPQGIDTKPMPYPSTELTDSATATGGSGFQFSWSWDLAAPTD
jgi:hypothetical protein